MRKTTVKRYVTQMLLKNSNNVKVGELTNNTSNSKISVVGILITCLVILLLSISILTTSPQTADAKTLADYDADIAAQETIVTEKENNARTAQKLLEEASAWYYKNVGKNAWAELLTGQTSIVELLDQIACMDAIYTTYQQQAAAANAARLEAENAQAALQQLKDEKTARAKSLENAKYVQFAQANGPWSGLSYWNGNIGSSGCGLCAYTVMIDVLTGNDYTPADMLNIRGDWRGMDGYPDDYTGSGGLTHAEWTLQNFDITMYNIDRNMEALKAELKEKESAAIVCVAGYVLKTASGSWYYTSGHFVTVVGYDEEGFHVSDSGRNSSEGTNVIYSDSDMVRMLSGASKVTIYKN